ncbi:MAG: hypothetical protein ACRCS9_11730 [Hyphomicrobium sp.]
MMLAIDWSEFFRIPAQLTIWHILESQFLTTLVAALFGFMLIRYEIKLREAQEEAQANREALDARNIIFIKEEALESEPNFEQATPPAQENSWEKTRKLVEESKKYLEDKAADDLDGRHRRTYEKISGHFPSDLALALKERRQIDDDQFESAFSIFSKWKKYARGRAARNPVSADVFEDIQRLRDRLIK